jgi:hypothetical protein
MSLVPPLSVCQYLPKRVCEPLMYYLMPSGMRTVNNTYAAATPTDAGNKV